MTKAANRHIAPTIALISFRRDPNSTGTGSADVTSHKEVLAVVSTAAKTYSMSSDLPRRCKLKCKHHGCLMLDQQKPVVTAGERQFSKTPRTLSNTQTTRENWKAVHTHGVSIACSTFIWLVVLNHLPAIKFIEQDCIRSSWNGGIPFGNHETEGESRPFKVLPRTRCGGESLLFFSPCLHVAE